MLKKIFGAAAGALILSSVVFGVGTVHTTSALTVCGHGLVKDGLNPETEMVEKGQRVASGAIDCGAEWTKLTGLYMAGTVGGFGMGGIAGWIIAGRRRKDKDASTTAPS